MKIFRFVSILLFSASSTLAQQTMNQAAVDTLTKDVAIAVFRGISQPKAQQIYGMLLDCGDDCDPQTVIRTVGSWDQVGAKMQELSELKNTQQFQTMSAAEANTAIRNQLAKFYAAHKAEKPYSVPLNPAVQAQILAKIDAMLPPAVTPEPAPAVSPGTVDAEPITDVDAATPSSDLRVSTLQTQVKKEQEKQFWMILLSALVGLIGGAAAVYFLLYRETKAEINRLRDENGRLSQSVDAAKRVKPVNEPRQPQPVDPQKAVIYDQITSELGTDDPIAAIRQLKQQTTTPPPPVAKPSKPTPESSATLESALVQPLLPATPETEPEPAPLRSEVFYCPPPDPTGQFDLTQKTEMLSPASAYRFSVSAENPSMATFRFEAEPGRVARFLTYRNYMIEPACDSENSYTATHTRVVMRRDGEAILENGTWRVKTKALIRYE